MAYRIRAIAVLLPAFASAAVPAYRIASDFLPMAASARTDHIFTKGGMGTQRIDGTTTPKYSVHMAGLRFEWDNAKERRNKRKHGVSFREAQSVFYDERAVRYFDPDHSEDEDRFIMLGMSFVLRVLVVCHCYREDDSIIRILSARRANAAEAREYAAYGGES